MLNKKTRFHNHNAYILPIASLNGVGYAEVFISYNTPIGVRIGGEFITSHHSYSSSTTRQKNRYIKEKINLTTYLERDTFTLLMRDIANKNGFSLGLLR